MNTASQIANENAGSAAGPWLQEIADGTASNLQAKLQPHALTVPVAATTCSNPANDNEGWEGGFEGHLGAYRRF